MKIADVKVGAEYAVSGHAFRRLDDRLQTLAWENSGEDPPEGETLQLDVPLPLLSEFSYYPVKALATGLPYGKTGRATGVMIAAEYRDYLIGPNGPIHTYECVVSAASLVDPTDYEATQFQWRVDYWGNRRATLYSAAR